MKNEKERKIRQIIEVVVAVIIILSVIQYKRVNDEPSVSIDASQVRFCDKEDVEYDDNHIITMTGTCIYYLGKPRTEIKYSESYKSDVFRYIIPFYATNISDKDSSEVDIDQKIRVFAAGNVWESLMRKEWDPENDLNDNTKWELKPGENGKGYAIVDVVIDELHTKEKLENYQVYCVARGDGKVLKYTLT